MESADDIRDAISAESFKASAGGSAAGNVEAIQSAFRQANLNGGGVVTITAPGVYTINDTLTVYSNTTLYLGPGVEVVMQSGVNKRVLKNAAIANATRACTLTASGNRITVNITAHGRSVGDAISLLNSTDSGYNGTYEVYSVTDENNYVVISPIVPSDTTADGTTLEKTADHDIRIIGEGILRGSGATGGTIEDYGVTIAFCKRLHYDVRFDDSFGWHLLTENVADVYVGALKGRATLRTQYQTNGPAFNINVVGIDADYSGDDIFALTTNNYAAYQLNNGGDIIGVKCGYIRGETAHAAFRIAGSSPWIVDDVHIGQIIAATVNGCVYLIADTGLAVTTIGRLVVDYIHDLAPPANWGAVYVNSGAFTSVTVDDLVVNGLHVEQTANDVYAALYAVDSADTIKSATFRNARMKGTTANGNIRVFKQIGDIQQAILEDSVLENGQGIWEHDSVGSAANQNLTIKNVRQINCSVGVATRRSISVHNAGGWVFDTALGTAVFSQATGGTISFYGDLPLTPSGYSRYWNFGAGLSGFVYYVGDVACTFKLIAAAAVRTMNATPVELVAAPGSGFALEFLRAEVFMDYGTAAYDAVGAGDDLEIRYTNGSGTLVGAVETTGFLDQTADQLRMIYPQTALGTGRFELTPTANAALVARFATGEIYSAAGDSPLYVKTWTRTRNTGRTFG